MKVLFTTSFRREEPNGVAVVSFQLADTMSKIAEVAIVCSGKTTHIDKKAGYPTLHVESVGDQQLNMHNFVQKNIKEVFDFLDDFSPDVIHSHVIADMSLLCLIWAVNHNVPFVQTIHSIPSKTSDWVEFGALGLIPKGVVNKLSLAYHEIFLRSTDGAVALNASVEKDLEKIGCKGKLFRIPNAVDIDRFKKLNISKLKYPIDLLFVGSIHPRKNQKFLIEVMKYLPKNKFNLHLIGQEQNQTYAKEIRDEIERAGLDNVKIHGVVDFDEIPEFLEGTDFFVSAALSEAQSIAIIEALASGTPVIGLSNETVDEFVGPDCGWNFAVDTEPSVFASKIESLAETSQSDYAVLSQTGRRKVSKLDWISIAQSTKQMYEVVLAKIREESSSKQKSRTLARLVSLIPSENIRERIFERFSDLKYEENSPDSKKKRKIPLVLWVWTILNIIVSIVSFAVIKRRSKKDETSKK